MANSKILLYLNREFKVKTPGEVTWTHAVNSIAKLKKSLEDPKIMFIETDIRMSDQGKIVAAHSSGDDSDLTVEHLLESLRNSKKGLKLDFKDPQAVSPTLKLLKSAGLNQPVLLNADILQGNGGNPTKFNPKEFIELCRREYPEGVLSLGWTITTSPELPYTQEDVQSMIDFTSDISEITFPVCACLLSTSWRALSKLLENPGRTLSVWNNEPLEKDLLAWIKQNTEPTRTFYDFTDENKDPISF